MIEKTIFVCNNCGNEFAKWSGKCLACGAWNSLQELKVEKRKGKDISPLEKAEVLKMDQITSANLNRVTSGVVELDRVLGGGIVNGSVILLGGDPGIGKSTLALQISHAMPGVFYISGEESAEQIKSRYDRIAGKGTKEGPHLVIETDIRAVKDILLKEKPKLAIIDSIQTMIDPEIQSSAGSLLQIRETAMQLINLAKQNNIALILIGHVTKEGNIAGPKILEHMVDVVLYLEGERYHDIRILRGLKNRYGDATEIGIFKMTSLGLEEVKNPSLDFLKERLAAPGSVVSCTLEGTRPFLVEVQALTSPTVFGYPKRTASGFDVTRLQLLLATISKRANINLSNQDVYLNIVGGVTIKDPAVDLAVVAAIISSMKNQPVREKTCIFGEVGLAGEVRKVAYADKRKKEAERLGFSLLESKKSIKEIIDLLF